MNSAAKRFLLIFFALYIGIALVVNILWGPPGYSSAYRAEYGTEHDQYLEIVKSDAYKLWKERPQLYEGDEAFEAQLAFVKTYEGREAFQKEERRRTLYGNFFQWYGFLSILVIGVRFGRQPLMAFLDEKVAEVRGKIERAAEARKEAQARKAAAETKLAGLPAEKTGIETETAGAIENERAQIAGMTQQTIEEIDKEAEDRKREEEHAAAMQVKRELVTRAVEQLIEDYQARMTAESEKVQVQQFIRDLETRA